MKSSISAELATPVFIFSNRMCEYIRTILSPNLTEKNPLVFRYNTPKDQETTT